MDSSNAPVSEIVFVMCYDSCDRIHPLLDDMFELLSFVAASVKGGARDSSIYRCLLLHWAHSPFSYHHLKTFD